MTMTRMEKAVQAAMNEEGCQIAECRIGRHQWVQCLTHNEAAADDHTCSTVLRIVTAAVNELKKGRK